MSFSFLDSQFNYHFFKEGDFNTEVSYLTNGTRIIENEVDSDKQISAGRGILSSTVINLPRIALKHKENINDFWEELNLKLDLVKDQLLERLDVQSIKKVYNFPFLMKQNVWIDSEKLKEDDRIKKVLKQGILQISFTGLNECLIMLTGKNYAESKKAQELGIQIITKMKEKAKEYSNKYNLTFTLAGNVDEEVNKAFLEFDRVIFGKIKNVTDKEMYTSSFELSEDIDIVKKIKLESAFHELTNGGHVINLKLKKNDDIMKIIKTLHDNEIGYAIVTSL